MLYEDIRLDYSYPHIIFTSSPPASSSFVFGPTPSMAIARRCSTSQLLLVGNSGLFSSEELDISAGTLFLKGEIFLP